MTVLALGAGAVSAAALPPVLPPDPASEAALRAAGAAAAAEALAALSARARGVASGVAEQAVVHRHLAGVDWHGPAASAFGWVLQNHVGMLQRMVASLEQLADEADHRAERAGSSW